MFYLKSVLLSLSPSAKLSSLLEISKHVNSEVRSYFVLLETWSLWHMYQPTSLQAILIDFCPKNSLATSRTKEVSSSLDLLVFSFWGWLAMLSRFQLRIWQVRSELELAHLELLGQKTSELACKSSQLVISMMRQVDSSHYLCCQVSCSQQDCILQAVSLNSRQQLVLQKK